MRPHVLAGFFTPDPEAILAAQDRLADADEPKRARVLRPRVDAFNAVLCRHGTLLGVADVAIGELARLNTASAFHHERLLGRRRAARLLEHASAVRRARKLPRLGPPN